MAYQCFTSFIVSLSLLLPLSCWCWCCSSATIIFRLLFIEKNGNHLLDPIICVLTHSVWSVFCVLCLSLSMWFYGWSRSHSSENAPFYYCYYFRNSGNLYGGKLNLTHMGFYSTNDKLLQIAFKETTIVRRLNVDGIRIRTMLVVGKYNSFKQNETVCTCTPTHSFVDSSKSTIFHRIACIERIEMCFCFRLRINSANRSTNIWIIHSILTWTQWIVSIIDCWLTYEIYSILGIKILVSAFFSHIQIDGWMPVRPGGVRQLCRFTKPHQWMNQIAEKRGCSSIIQLIRNSVIRCWHCALLRLLIK